MGRSRRVRYTHPMSVVPSESADSATASFDQAAPVVIVGGGLAGLACAVDLHRHRRPFVLLESGDACGGRVRTDWVDGFPCDRGFQVYLPGYPVARAMLDHAGLDLRSFTAGAIIYDGTRTHRLGDPLQNPGDAWATITTPVVTLADKLRMGWLKLRAAREVDQLATVPERSTLAELRTIGFSAKAIEHFFRPFFGGVFLDRSLATTNRMMLFTYAMFGRGGAAWPAMGMQAIPDQLAAMLPPDSVRFHATVTDVTADSVTLAGGETIAASQVVVATDHLTASVLLPSVAAPPPQPATTTLYFTTPTPPTAEPTLMLNGSGRGRVNSVTVLTAAVPERCIDGRHLISVALQEQANVDDRLVEQVQRELSGWLDHVDSWSLLHDVTVTHALPNQSPDRTPPGVGRVDGAIVCGDWRTYGSIEHAIRSGREAASMVLTTR